jgi:hypothetical protein
VPGAGVRGGANTALLNDRRRLDYFDTHVPSVAARGTTTWIFVTRRPVPRGAPFVKVGRQRPGDANRARSLPSIRVAAGKRPHGRAVTGTVLDKSGVPQQDLVVYAYAERGGRPVAAGNARIAALVSGQSARFRLHLVGSPRGGRIRAQAPPTMLK